MSSVASPFGFQPVQHPSGFIRPMNSTIVSTYNTGILQFAPVKIDGTDGTLKLAAATDAFVGTFLGVEYQTTDNRIVYSNQWVANTALATNTKAKAYYTLDPYIIYQIQANGSITQANVGNQGDFTTTTAGNTTTGLSSVALDTASLVASAANKQLRIIGLVPGPDNDFGDAFTNVLVQISKHQNVAVINAY